MTTAQHAESILAAWNQSNRSGLETALNNALVSCTATRSISRLEAEQQEVLESVVQHLRSFKGNGHSYHFSCGGGALALLSHLSSGLNPFGVSGLAKGDPSQETLKFGVKRPKCFVAAVCSPEIKSHRQ